MAASKEHWVALTKAFIDVVKMLQFIHFSRVAIWRKAWSQNREPGFGSSFVFYKGRCTYFILKIFTGATLEDPMLMGG